MHVSAILIPMVAFCLPGFPAEPVSSHAATVQVNRKIGSWMVPHGTATQTIDSRDKNHL